MKNEKCKMKNNGPTISSFYILHFTFYILNFSFFIVCTVDQRRIVFSEGFAKLPQRAEPEHLGGGTGPVHALGDLVERESLEVAQEDHLLVVGRQGGQRGAHAELGVELEELL